MSLGGLLVVLCPRLPGSEGSVSLFWRLWVGCLHALAPPLVQIAAEISSFTDKSTNVCYADLFMALISAKTCSSCNQNAHVASQLKHS